tara:strand:- start:1273 stop:1449 length:177 start_codon:yes stop_codon:yes gene_type:complete
MPRKNDPTRNQIAHLVQMAKVNSLLQAQVQIKKLLDKEQIKLTKLKHKTFLDEIENAE